MIDLSFIDQLCVDLFNDLVGFIQSEIKQFEVEKE